MRSTRYAAILASGYTLLAAVYIVVSSNIAAHLSASLEQLQYLETLKGILYVVVTAIAIFFGARYAFGRLERAHEHIVARDRALLDNERRVFAGLIAGSIAHDANNVLVGVIADLEELRASRAPNDLTVHRLRISVERLVALNQRLLSTARRGGVARAEDVDLGHVIRETLAVARSHVRVRRCRLEFDPHVAVPLHTNPLLVQQVVTNLVVNAGEATGGTGRIEIRLAGSPTGATIEVHDDGPGVPPERRERIFEALETTKPGGSGLGLFSVKSCVTALRGEVEVDDSPLGGACFRVLLTEGPRDPATAMVPAGAAPATAAGRTPARTGDTAATLPPR